MSVRGVRRVLVAALLAAAAGSAVAWAPDSFPDPKRDVNLCGRKGKASNICDPDGVISYEAANRVEGVIKDIWAGVDPFVRAPCADKGLQGYQVRAAPGSAARRPAQAHNTTPSRLTAPHHAPSLPLLAAGGRVPDAGAGAGPRRERGRGRPPRRQGPAPEVGRGRRGLRQRGPAPAGRPLPPGLHLHGRGRAAHADGRPPGRHHRRDAAAAARRRRGRGRRGGGCGHWAGPGGAGPAQPVGVVPAALLRRRRLVHALLLLASGACPCFLRPAPPRPAQSPPLAARPDRGARAPARCCRQSFKQRRQYRDCRSALRRVKDEQEKLRTKEWSRPRTCPVCLEAFAADPEAAAAAAEAGDEAAEPTAPLLPSENGRVQDDGGAGPSSLAGPSSSGLRKRGSNRSLGRAEGGAAAEEPAARTPISLPCGHTFCEPCERRVGAARQRRRRHASA
jgi:hypothetical protein